jgi:hypothetical protein
LEVQTPEVRYELRENAGGCIVRAVGPAGEQLLSGPSADIVSYYDSGGMWRMGTDFAGGAFREVARASSRPARLNVREVAGGLEVVSAHHLDGMTLVRRLRFFGAGEAPLRIEVTGSAATRRTVALRVETGLRAPELVMDTPGGVIARPFRRGYNPTFWALHSFVHLAGPERGVALCTGLPGSVSGTPAGRLEAITQRNALIETAYGFLNLASNPVRGHESRRYTAELALLFTGPGDPLEHDLPAAAYRIGNGTAARAARARLDALAAALVQVDPPGVLLVAFKPVQRGEGTILRLYGPGRRGAEVRLAFQPGAVRAAWLCDSRERDLRPLDVQDGVVRLAMPGSIATVRVMG